MAFVLAMAEAPTATAAPMTGSQSPICGAAGNSVVQKVRRFPRRGAKIARDGTSTSAAVAVVLAARRAAITHRGKRYWRRDARCDTYCEEVGPLRVYDRDCD